MKNQTNKKPRLKKAHPQQESPPMLSLVPEEPKTPAREKTFEGPIFIDGVKHFSKTDLLRYELIQHKIVVSYQNVGLKQVEIEKTRAAFNAKLNSLDHEFRELQAEQVRKEAEYKILQDELADLYQMDLSKVTYDDTSGLIHVHETSSSVDSGTKK